MTVLITGGTGFIGLNIVERLVERGHDVIALGHAPPPWSLSESARRRCKIIIADIRSIEALERALAGRRPQTIVHAAAVTPAPERERDAPDEVANVNFGGTIAILQLARRLDVKRVVVLSSAAVYGSAGPEQGRLAASRTQPKPTSLYGITKLAAEQAALHLGTLYGIDIRAVRLGPAFGRYEYATGLRDTLSPHWQIVQCALEGREVLLSRPCAADWIYAGDAAAGIVGVLETDCVVQPVFDLGGGQVTDALMWCEAIARHFRRLKWRIVEGGEQANIAYRLPPDRAPLDNTAVTTATGIEPRSDTEAAAADYLEWCRVGTT